MGKTIKTNIDYPITTASNFYIAPISAWSDIATELSDSDFLNNLANLFTDKSDYVVGAKYYPFSLWNTFFTRDSATAIKVGDTTFTNAVGQLITISPNMTGIRKIASVDVTPYFNNFMDYAPYTKLRVYLPFLYWVDLDTNAVMGKTINIYYGIDLYTGEITAWIECDNTLISTYTQKVAMELPLGKTNAHDIMIGNITNGLKFVSGVATTVAGAVTSSTPIGIGLTASGIGLMASSSINAITNNQKEYSHGGVSSGALNLAMPTSVILEIKRPNPVAVDIANYRKLKGLPLGEIRLLSTLTGFTQCSNVHLDGFINATSEEINVINNALVTGVIL